MNKTETSLRRFMQSLKMVFKNEKKKKIIKPAIIKY